MTIVLRAVGPGPPLLELADELSRAMCVWGKVAVLHAGEADGGVAAAETRADAVARFSALVERCELEHDQVLMVSGAEDSDGAWGEFCLSHADRVLTLVGGPMPADGPAEAGADDRSLRSLRGSDLVGYGVRRGSSDLTGWIASLAPASTFTISDGHGRKADVARVARRLAGRSTGIVLAGGGARAFAHLGALEVLLDAGMLVDRVGGVSMGSFIGGLLACGHDSAAMDACCYEEWVRRNPINDYTVPRAALIKGQKAEAMLERVFGEVKIEELARSFYCASVDLRSHRLVIDRDGSMMHAVGASISLPLIAPPLRRDERLLIDGSLLDNLPLAPMSSSGEGPVVAIDIKGSDDRGPTGSHAHGGGSPAAASKRLPSLPETMARIALLSSANTGESARRHADLTIEVRVAGVGLLEFHQIDAAREAGRDAAMAVLDDAPAWLLSHRPNTSSLAGRRTVVRV